MSLCEMISLMKTIGSIIYFSIQNCFYLRFTASNSAFTYSMSRTLCHYLIEFYN